MRRDSIIYLFFYAFSWISFRLGAFRLFVCLFVSVVNAFPSIVFMLSAVWSDPVVSQELQFLKHFEDYLQERIVLRLSNEEAYVPSTLSPNTH